MKKNIFCEINKNGIGSTHCCFCWSRKLSLHFFCGESSFSLGNLPSNAPQGRKIAFSACLRSICCYSPQNFEGFPTNFGSPQNSPHKSSPSPPGKTSMARWLDWSVFWAPQNISWPHASCFGHTAILSGTLPGFWGMGRRLVSQVRFSSDS